MAPKIPSKSASRRNQPSRGAPARTRDEKNKHAYQGKDEISLSSLDPRRQKPSVVLDAGPVAAAAEPKPEERKGVLQMFKGLIKS